MKLRIAIFGSFYRGEHLIKALLAFQEEYPELVEFCGIATDDPFQGYTSPQKRVWQYVDDDEKRVRVEAIATLAREHNIPLRQDKVKTDEFDKAFRQWAPDIVYMGTFGQRIPACIFEQPIHGFLNFHPTVDHREWPSYVGGNPFQDMLSKGEKHGAIALHEVNEKFDDGPLIAYSGNFPIYPEDDVVSLHKRTSIEAAKMMEWHLRIMFKMPQPRYAIRPMHPSVLKVPAVA